MGKGNVRRHRCSLPIRYLALRNALSRQITCTSERAGRERTSEHTDDAEEDLLDALNGTPALVGRLVRVWIVAWGMEDGDAHVA